MVAKRPVTAVANATASSDYFAAVTPADTDLPFVTRAIYIGETGTLTVRRKDGTDVPLVNFAVGVPHPLEVVQIRSTGTTGITNVVAVY